MTAPVTRQKETCDASQEHLNNLGIRKNRKDRKGGNRRKKESLHQVKIEKRSQNKKLTASEVV